MESLHIFQEKLFDDVQSVTQMLTKYNRIIQKLSEPEVSIKIENDMKNGVLLNHASSNVICHRCCHRLMLVQRF